MFCDNVTIKLTSGKGGNGNVSFLHEKYREKGGPDGGDGGDGGSVFIVSDPSVNTLYDYKTKTQVKALSGENGKKNRKKGATAEDLYIKVPIGTVVYGESNDVLADLAGEGQSFLAAIGGEGGYGNAHFVSSVRQAPQVAELGEYGEEKIVRLELKLIADVGLVGLPNVGKSTLLSVISAAKPKIADYAFTTLIPNLGVVDGGRFGIKNFSFVVADIPGLIEGASEGKGLGDEFLRHVERTKVLIHIVDATSENPTEDFKSINKELEVFSADLIKKPQIVAISKADITEDAKKKAKDLAKYLKKKSNIRVANIDPFVISSPTHQGIKELISEVALILRRELKKKPKVKETREFKKFTAADIVEDRFLIEKEDDRFVVSGRKIEKFARKTDFNNSHAKARLLDIMHKMGILKELDKRGARSGSMIEIEGKKFRLGK